MEQPDYDAWVKKTIEESKKGPDLSAQSHDELVSKGAAVYAKNCVTCHGAEGKGIPGAFPAITASPVVTGDINAQTKLVLNGKGGMPAFAKMLKADELAQVITYTRNSLGNKVGDEIHPKAIQELLPQTSGAAAPAAKAAPQEKIDASVVLSKEALVAKGKSVYAGSCASCHQAEGQGMPPAFPALTRSAVVKGDINAQVDLMLHGKGAMPAFGAMLSATDFAAVVTYTRNGLGNSVNDAIQPSAIQALQAAMPAAKDDD
jgi:cytochrome c oxidase subunit 2